MKLGEFLLLSFKYFQGYINYMNKYKKIMLTLEEDVIKKLHEEGYNISFLVRKFLNEKLNDKNPLIKRDEQ